MALKESDSGSYKHLQRLLEPHETYCCFRTNAVLRVEYGQLYRDAFTRRIWTPLYTLINTQYALDNYCPKEFQAQGMITGWDQVQAVSLKSGEWYLNFWACKFDGTAGDAGVWLVERTPSRPKLSWLHELLKDLLADRAKEIGLIGIGRLETEVRLVQGKMSSVPR